MGGEVRDSFFLFSLVFFFFFVSGFVCLFVCLYLCIYICLLSCELCVVAVCAVGMPIVCLPTTTNSLCTPSRSFNLEKAVTLKYST